MRTSIALAVAFLALTTCAALAEDIGGADNTAPPPPSEENTPAILSGTLKKIRDSGVVTIGYREASFPFSYVRKESPLPLGYSIDLCLGIVDEVVRELNGNPTRVAYQAVTSDTRMEAVISGKVDLECGSTTSNLERQKSVAFSSIIYVAGTKLMAKRGSGINSYKDMSGKTLVVTSGTTNEAAMKLLNDKYKLGISIVSARDHEESYNLLADGKADAFATDDVLLYGFIIAKKAEATMAVVGDFITYEPYGIMFRKDDPLMQDAVRRAFETMGRTRSLVSIYRKWFLQPTPSGELVNLPISLQLAETFRSLGADDF
ncbi:amino acid ABC transporter substrate-binding protein, PAAT family [Rhizobiales bacterium GAS191]|nr:amino acid ABC transporter substrate-binding protein, PAAT family [Rhizobiales bacterium GAS113]SEE07765.1 amino acid ABC transporter substrate-binding protein, PAAT family [Rhizobiales bacterium GAS191]